MRGYEIHYLLVGKQLVKACTADFRNSLYTSYSYMTYSLSVTGVRQTRAAQRVGEVTKFRICSGKTAQLIADVIGE